MKMKNQKLGKILKIQEIYNDRYSGFEIQTDKTKIELLISNFQNFCEQWGYLLSEDDFTKFIGSNVLEIEFSAPTFHKKIKELENKENTYFVDIKTNKGLLQFAAYNEHNGYYGHEVLVKIGDDEESFTL